MLQHLSNMSKELQHALKWQTWVQSNQSAVWIWSHTSGIHVHWTLISRSSPVKQLFWIRGNGHISHIQMSERLSVKLLDVTLLSRPTETPVTQNTWECRQLVWGTRGFKWLNMFVFMCENDYCSSAEGCINHRNIQLTEWNWKYNRMCRITEGLCCISFFHCVPVHVSSTLLSQEQSALLFSPAVTSTFRRFTWRPEPNLTDRCWKQQELTRVLLYMKKQSASLACCLAHIQHPAF